MTEGAAFHESFEAAERALDDGQPHEALRALRPRLEEPTDLDHNDGWQRGFLLFARVADQLGGERLGGFVRAIADRPEGAEAYYDCAYELYEQGLHGIAVTVLERARSFEPESPRILSELVANLEALMRNKDACRALNSAPSALESSAMCRYLLGFNAVMTGDLAAGRAQLETLRPEEDESITQVAEALEGMLVRAEALSAISPLDRSDLRGWHLVLTGALLLHISPYGFDAGMNGRYAYIADSLALCRDTIELMAAALAAAGYQPPRVFALPDRASRILARAAATYLERPLEPWPEGGAEDAGLIVAYDLARVGDSEALGTLRDHRPGQLLWSHAACWTEPYPYAADLTGLLYQSLTAPWDAGRLSVDPESGELRQSEADEDTEDALAERILAAEPSEDDEAARNTPAALRPFIEVGRAIPPPHRPGLFRRSGRRLRDRAGSPVPSNFFR